MEDILFMGLNNFMEYTIKISNTIISIKAKVGLCIPKNKKLHKAFTPSCNPKINNALFFPVT